MVIALLIGRKGSKGFPGKNLHKICGQPMAYYPMKAALDCSDVDKVYISTDDEKLMALAAKNGVDVIKRPPGLCSDKALGEDVYIHAYGAAKDLNKGKRIEFLVLLMCNAPTVTAGIIKEGIAALRENSGYDSAVTVSRYNMWSPLRARKILSDGLLHPFIPFEALGDKSKLNCDRDSQGDAWFADMGVSIIRPECLERIGSGLLPQRWMGRNIYPLKQWGGLDVDYEWQIPQIEYWLKANVLNKEKKRHGK